MESKRCVKYNQDEGMDVDCVALRLCCNDSSCKACARNVDRSKIHDSSLVLEFFDFLSSFCKALEELVIPGGRSMPRLEVGVIISCDGF